jgi:uncharacterized RDD family membrane protein YckC
MPYPPGTPYPPAGQWPPGVGHPPTVPPTAAGQPGAAPAHGPAYPPGHAWPGPVPPAGWVAYPYRAAVPAPRPHGLSLASLTARLLARIIDILVVLALNVVVNGWFVRRYVEEVAPFYRAFIEQWRQRTLSPETLPQVGEQAGSLEVAILVIAAALWFAYEVPATANTGQTVGKRLMGIKVVALETSKPLGFGRSLRRWTVLGLPSLLWPCGVGFLLQLVDCVFPVFDRPLRLALHDKRVQTVVVQVPSKKTSDPNESSSDAPQGDANDPADAR